MAAKLILEFDEHRQIFNLDELAKSFLEAIQIAVRHEVERALSLGTIPISQQVKAPS